jgi:fructosamine-3-kinase
MNLSPIFMDAGLVVRQYQPVPGGDVNQAYCLQDSGGKYFLKVNNANKFPEMFAKEKEGLQALHHNSPLVVPEVIKHGAADGQQYLLLKWIEPGSPGPRYWEQFGASMALMHQPPQPYFGWENNNYIGKLPQSNEKQAEWGVFFTQCRIMPLIKRLFDGGVFNKQDVAATYFFCKRSDEIFPTEPPSLLHGDLWNGNFMATVLGDVAIFDPAVYYGHREMDIGMSKLFGGFDSRFYEAYNDVYPMKKGWLKRVPFTQIYPLLVHAILFGGHYAGKVKEIIKAF